MTRCSSVLIWCIRCFFALPFSISAFGDSIKVLATEYPPYTTSHASDSGIFFRYLDMFAQKELDGVEFEAVFVPPARAQILVEGANHCMSFYPPLKGNKDYGFFPLGNGERVKLGLIRKRQSGAFTWDDLSELKGSNVAMLRRTDESRMRENFIKSGVSVVSVETVLQGVRMLEKGRVDYAFGDNSSLSYFSAYEERSFEHLQFSTSYLQDVHIGFFYRKDCIERIFGKESARLLTHQ